MSCSLKREIERERETKVCGVNLKEPKSLAERILRQASPKSSARTTKKVFGVTVKFVTPAFETQFGTPD